MIDSLLLLRGFAAVPGPGGARKIIAINGSPSPWTPDAQLPDSDAPVTTLLRLENANATDLVPVITPYLGTNSTAAAFEPTNSLILSGPASLLRTLRIAIDALDQRAAGAPLIWPMRVAGRRDGRGAAAGDRGASSIFRSCRAMCAATRFSCACARARPSAFARSSISSIAPRTARGASRW